MGAVTFANKLSIAIVNPLLFLLFTMALAYFVYGIMVFLIRADDESARTSGRSAMLWGVIGMVIMASVFFILRVTLNTVGVQNTQLPSSINAKLPNL